MPIFSKGSRPEAQLTWLRNGSPVGGEAAVTSSVRPLPGLKTMTVSSLRLAVTAAMHGDTISCEAAHPALATPATVHTRLAVEARPGLALRLQNQGPVYEVTETCPARQWQIVLYNIQGDTVRLLCDSASPDLSWTVGGRVVTEAAGSRLLELAASRRLQGAAVTCAATTEAGTNTATLKLDIKCEFIY